jgi:hypothetical protein
MISMSAHHEARAKVRSSDEEVPLTHGRGVLRQRLAAETAATRTRTRTPPVCLPGAGAGKRVLSAQETGGPLRLLRTTPVTCGIAILSKVSPRRCALVFRSWLRVAARHSSDHTRRIGPHLNHKAQLLIVPRCSTWCTDTRLFGSRSAC